MARHWLPRFWSLSKLPNHFACLSRDQCLPQTALYLCVVVFCVDSDNSLNRIVPEVNNRVNCPPNHFACLNGDRCVPQTARCDERYDCSDFSDESNCGEETTQLTFQFLLSIICAGITFTLLENVLVLLFCILYPVKHLSVCNCKHRRSKLVCFRFCCTHL